MFPGLISNIAGTIIHIPVTMILVRKFGLTGCAVSLTIFNLNVLIIMVAIIYIQGLHKKTWSGFTVESLSGV